MNKTMKQLLSMVLAVVMVVALLPANILSVFAVAPERISLYAPLYQYDKDNGTGKLSVGQQITAKAKDAEGNFIDAQNITFTTSDATVVTVDEAGVMTGVHSGTATVTAAHKEDENVKASLTVTVTNVSTYVSGLHAFNVGYKTDGVLDYGQNLAGNYGYADNFSPADWSDSDATHFIPFQLLNPTGEHGYSTGLDHIIARSGVGWYIRPSTSDYTQYISDWKYANYIHSAPWVWGDLSNYETVVPYSGERSSWQINPTSMGVYAKDTTVANNPYYSYKLNVPSAGTYTVDFSASKVDLVLSL